MPKRRPPKSNPKQLSKGARPVPRRPGARESVRGLSQAAQQGIHKGLTGDRALIGQRYLDTPELYAAYADTIAPRTRVALERVFSQISRSSMGQVRPDPTSWPTRALDLGFGTGAASAFVRERYGDKVPLVGVDWLRGRETRAAARALNVTYVEADLRQEAAGGALGAPTEHLGGHFDLIVSAHLLNELAKTQGAGSLVVGWAKRWLAEDGVFVIIEPALKETSRTLLKARDALLDAGFGIHAPCFFQGRAPR